jgi:hypothetical protein
MCGRYTFKFTWREIHDLLGVTAPSTTVGGQPASL